VKPLNASDELALKEKCYFDERKGAYAISFIEKWIVAPHGFNPNKPITLLPWQRDLISYFYGWRQANGKMRFKNLYLTIAKQVLPSW
jgi:phage terminase large subunit-like protein